MRQGYDAALGARLTIDDAGRVTGIDHHDRHWPASATSPRLAAIEYLGEVAGVLDLPRRELQRLHQPVTALAAQRGSLSAGGSWPCGSPCSSAR